MVAMNGDVKGAVMWKSSDRGKLCIKIKPAWCEVLWRLALPISGV